MNISVYSWHCLWMPLLIALRISMMNCTNINKLAVIYYLWKTSAIAWTSKLCQFNSGSRDVKPSMDTLQSSTINLLSIMFVLLNRCAHYEETVMWTFNYCHFDISPYLLQISCLYVNEFWHLSTSCNPSPSDMEPVSDLMCSNIIGSFSYETCIWVWISFLMDFKSKPDIYHSLYSHMQGSIICIMMVWSAVSNDSWSHNIQL